MRAADLVVVTGDLVSGPMPAETLDALMAPGSRCLLVRGNADREVVDVARGGSTSHPESVFAAESLARTSSRCWPRSSRWGQALADLSESVRTVCCGHTHMPVVRLVDRRLVVNPGSIGMPYGRVGGAWALLRDGQVGLRHTPIDVDAVCERIVVASSYPQARAWVDGYVRGVHSDVDALTAFGPRDGR